MDELQRIWLGRIQNHCSGDAQQIIDLVVQDNLESCVFPYVSKLLIEEPDIPLPILRTLLSLFGREAGAPYVACLLHHQRGPNAKELCHFLNQLIIEATNRENAEFVFSKMRFDFGPQFQICLLAKIVASSPELIGKVHDKYATLMKCDREALIVIPQWKRKYPDRAVRAGLKTLETYALDIAR